MVGRSKVCNMLFFRLFGTSTIIWGAENAPTAKKTSHLQFLIFAATTFESVDRKDAPACIICIGACCSHLCITSLRTDTIELNSLL